MPRKPRVEFAGAIYHVMSRGDGREAVCRDDVDRQSRGAGSRRWRKTGFEVHAYCLMRNHFHLVLDTPEANLVAGMGWLPSAYTIRFNHRHQLVGHVFGGRYKALLVEGGGNGYLKTVCDYAYLVRKCWSGWKRTCARRMRGGCGGRVRSCGRRR